MPALSRWFIKTGLVYFVASFILGVTLKIPSLFDAWLFMPAMTPVYFHLFMIGWITQIIIGVSWWMFPAQSREHPRGSDRVGWFVYFCINAGLLARAVGEPLVYVRPDQPIPLLVSAGLLWFGGVVYAVQIWKRVKGK
ncbi:hypothetical protein K1X84_10265 [bacterium]|nr:hypothetical protein [bacterium]